ncbi:MAG: hypothetical protein L6V88_00300 [Anaerotruncus sp.]|nr:MAG: hypothetical protein L6V88_00300 [Anaerotruncus sp.]
MQSYSNYVLTEKCSVCGDVHTADLKAAFNSKTGDSNYDSSLDADSNGYINVRDHSIFGKIIFIKNHSPQAFLWGVFLCSKRPFAIIFLTKVMHTCPIGGVFDILIYIAFINFGIFILYRLVYIRYNLEVCYA